MRCGDGILRVGALLSFCCCKLACYSLDPGENDPPESVPSFPAEPEDRAAEQEPEEPPAPGRLEGTPDAVTEFYRGVAPILGGENGRSGACGPCHSVSGGIGPGFLEPNPDMLTTVLAYPYLVGEAPESSRLYAKGAHHGSPGFEPGDAAIVAAWIVLLNVERRAVRERAVPVPQITPFAPLIGANTVDLSALDPALAGSTITFEAALIDASIQGLGLSRLTVRNGGAAGLRIVHPLFSTWASDSSVTPDPADSFSGLDHVFEPGSAEPLGPGVLLLPGFRIGQQINVSFRAIEGVER